jgi:predicted acylesterase/phospholipase RssA
MRNPKTPSIEQIEPKDELALPASEKKDVFILSLDGGGMRGLISTAVVSGFIQILKEKGFERTIPEAFDMVAGTSTGGLIATALTCPSMLGRTAEQGPALASADQLSDIYLLYGNDIFSEAVPSILNAVSDKYSPRKLESLLHLWYGSTMFSSCVIPTLVMGYNATSGLPFPMASTENRTLYSWEVSRATSAAPTYFPPFQLGNQLIVDGGVIANNPSLYAYRYARTLWPKCRRIHILSVSTCGAIYRYQSMATYGISSWTSVYKVYASAQQQTADEMMECLPDADYVRIYKELKDKIDMDDTSEETLLRLQQSGNDLLKQFRPALEAFADRLIAVKDPSRNEPEPSMEPIQKRLSFIQRLRSWVKR